MPDRTTYLANLARTLDQACGTNGGSDHLEQALAHLAEAVSLPSAPALQRMAAARQYGELAASVERTTEAADAFATAVRSLPSAVWHGLDRRAQEDRLSRFDALAGDTAAWQVTAGRFTAAIELLEVGRSVLWQHALNTRPDLDRVRAADPLLAARLIALAGRYRSPANRVERRW